MIRIFATEEDAQRFSANLQAMAEAGLRAIGEAERHRAAVERERQGG